MNNFTKKEIEEAIPLVTSLISKCEKVIEKLKQGTPQHSLIKNRIDALKVAEALMKEALEKMPK